MTKLTWPDELKMTQTNFISNKLNLGLIEINYVYFSHV